MRLIDTHTMMLEDFTLRKKPKYAILSHTWGTDEVSYQEFIAGSKSLRRRKGWWKIAKTCQQARHDNLLYAWVDTCCIDKTSSAELSEAINSMYQWYADSAICYVYLIDADANKPANEENLRNCRWWKRGWTLQELLAPRKQAFYDKFWKPLGTKETLLSELSKCARIDAGDLNRASYGYPTIETISTRMSWYGKRKTTRIEDEAYCLMGIFEVNMPLIYGEGRRAFRRLQEEIAKRSNDLTLFAHECRFFPGHTELFATSPQTFRPAFWAENYEYEVVSSGIRFSKPVSLHQLDIIEATEIEPATPVYALCIGGDYQSGYLIYMILEKFAPGKFERPSRSLEIVSRGKRCSFEQELLTVFGQGDSRQGLPMSYRLPVFLGGDLQAIDGFPRYYWDYHKRTIFLDLRARNQVYALLLASEQYDSTRVLVLIDDRNQIEYKTKLLPLDSRHGHIIADLLMESRGSSDISMSWTQLILYAPWVSDYTDSLTMSGFSIVSTSSERLLKVAVNTVTDSHSISQSNASTSRAVPNCISVPD